jgi:hypothetical protein
MAVNTTPAYLQAGTYPASLDRLYQISSRFLPTTLNTVDVACRSGILGGQSGRQANASMTNWDVNVGRFVAVVENTFASNAGDYAVYSDLTQTLAITPSSPTTNRIDIIGVRVQDAFYTGVVNSADLAVVQGTPAAGTPAAPALPASFMPLWQVTVNAGTSTGTLADLRKRTAIMGAVYSPFTPQLGDNGTMVGEMQILPAAGAYPVRLRTWDGSAWRGVTSFAFDEPVQTGSGSLTVGTAATVKSVSVADPGYPFKISVGGSIDWAMAAASAPGSLLYGSITLNSTVYNVGAITSAYEISESLGASFSQPPVEIAGPINTATQAAGSSHTIRLIARNSGASSMILPLNGPATKLGVVLVPA